MVFGRQSGFAQLNQLKIIIFREFYLVKGQNYFTWPALNSSLDDKPSPDEDSEDVSFTLGKSFKLQLK